ncbi:hypothetical protein ANO11243_049920 [Dothideomycetidae sp. 11243]|nr:hypothetical protein ANO11243_049920 [fungal sp. No.11243]
MYLMRSLFRQAWLLILPVRAHSAVATSTNNQYETWADQALVELQTFYNSSTGLWHSFPPSWWQSANALTTLADMVALNGTNAVKVANVVIPNTFRQAAAFNEAHNHHTKRGSSSSTTTACINGFYDDEGWWAMAWIRAFDVTAREEYLSAAEGLFADMVTGWGTNCSSEGMWWDKAHTEINPIANVLFLEVAAYLAKRVPAQQQTYVNWALRGWNWLQQSGMWEASSHILSGAIDVESCQLHPGTHGWTYAQGTLIQALTELSDVTGNSTLLDQAVLVADAVIALDTGDGILVEPGIAGNPPTTDQSAEQFKGVFMRGLARLQRSRPDSKYQAFAEKNAQSVWSNRKGAALGFDWQDSFVGPADASMQSSAMDCLVAAWSMTS